MVPEDILRRQVVGLCVSLYPTALLHLPHRPTTTWNYLTCRIYLFIIKVPAPPHISTHSVLLAAVSLTLSKARRQAG